MRHRSFRAALPPCAAAILLCLTACGDGGAGDSSGTVAYRGVNLAGADFGEQQLPGTYGVDYVYPEPANATYFVDKGMNVFRLPFRWERLQPALFGPFDATELDRLRRTVAGINDLGATVVVDPHNYARYFGEVVGQGNVTFEAFADFWSRLARELTNANVILGLMNEPHDMSTDVWVQAANAAIAAIRATGAKQLVLVPGNAWTGAYSWSQSWYGTPNATAMLRVADPENNYAFEAHQYLDATAAGTSASCVSATIGEERLAGFTRWLKANKKRGFLGEFGGGPDATCATAIGREVGHVEANGGVWTGWTYWAAGPWWGDGYFTTLEPQDGVDRPQMDALERYLVLPAARRDAATDDGRLDSGADASGEDGANDDRP